MQLTKSFTITADSYDIAISDRVVLSENLTGPGIQAFFAANGLPAVQGGRYFTNAINTTTAGLDVVACNGIDLKRYGLLRLTAGYNQNKTKVTRVVVNTPAQLGNLDEQLFGQAERGRIEVGQPRNNLLLTGMYERKNLTLTARTQRFGEVTSIALRATITIGSDNVFDVYPDQNMDRGDVATNYAGQGTFGVYRYSGLSPFGFNGRYVYARVGYSR